MRILSLNAWGGALFEDLRAWLPSCGADVICLQEVTRTPGLGGWTTFADGERTLPQRADLFGDLLRLLPGHQGHFLVSDSGPVVDDGGRRWEQDFGIATFVAPTVAVIGTASRFVHGAYTRHQDWAVEDRPRVAHGVRVSDRRGGAVTVVQAHGLRDPAGKGDTPARREQARRIAELCTTLAGQGDVAVACGDLNVLPDSVTFQELEAVGLTDLVGRTDTRTSRYAKPVRHASYLLVSDPSAVRRFEVVRAPEVSDHRALVVELGSGGIDVSGRSGVS